jgi:deoxyribodipyrimidine photo-lyase
MPANDTSTARPTDKHKKTLHIFRRDFRLVDNTALINACKQSEQVIPVFIFTYKQLRDNKLKSNNCVQFMIESLDDLAKQLTVMGSRLRFYYGDEMQIIRSLLTKHPDITCISFNRDFTRYSMERDTEITELATELGRQTLVTDDITLHPIGDIRTTTGKVYTKYTPFMRQCLAKDIREPDGFQSFNSHLLSGQSKLSGPSEFSAARIHEFYGGKPNPHLPEHGGRQVGLKILAEITRKHEWRDYNSMRDQLTYQTTHLSPFNKFGCVSVREVYWAIRHSLGPSNELLRQLAWRDFFYNLSYANPHIYSGPMNRAWDDIPWETDPAGWRAWTTGRTGFPVVDACMQEINTTGYMHNRGRLIVSNFLSRLLHIDWRRGEHYFAQLLYDYDPAQNSFGWQLNACVSGTESRPLNQTILNPWIQSAKYDHDAKYIKQWLPELKDVPAAHLHNWAKFAEDHIAAGLKYPAPILDYTTEKARNLAIYKKSYKS